MTDCGPSRAKLAANVRALDDAFFRALCEPVRVRLLTHMVELGPADIGTIAEGFPQDRSVISRHLQVLRQAGVVIARKEGRHVYYEIDGPEIVGRLEHLTDSLRHLVPLCCPGR